MSLKDLYVEACATPSDINEHLATFVSLVEELDAKTVIELGTRGGVSTIAWLYALEGRGHLWSVDIDPAPALDYDHWVFLQGDDCSTDIYSQLPSPVDIVFIDTSHDYLHTRRELSLYRWLLRPGGVFVLHDTELAHPEHVHGAPFPVKRAIEHFCRHEGFEWENHPNCFGLGIIRV